MRIKIKNINEYKTNNEITEKMWFDAIIQGDLELVKDYINKGYDINHQGLDDDTALIYACRLNQLEIVKELLKYPNLEINFQNRWKNNALMYACSNNNLEIVKELLKRKDIDVNLINELGFTALNFSVKLNYTDIIKELLKHPDIDVNIKNIFEIGAIYLAKKNKNYEVLNLLREAGAIE